MEKQPPLVIAKPEISASKFYVDEKRDFGILNVMMSALGTPAWNDDGRRSRGNVFRRVRTLFATAFIHAYLLHSVIYVFYDYEYTWIRLMDFLRCLSAIVPFDILLCRKRKIGILVSCHKEMVIKNGYADSRIKKKMYFVISLIMSLTISMYLLQLSVYCLRDPAIYLEGFVYHTNITKLGHVGASCLCCVDATLFFSFIWGLSGVFVIYYQVYCFIFQLHLKSVAQHLSQNLYQWGEEKISNLSKKLLSISNCVAALDDVFSIAVLWWYIETMGFVCVNVHSALVDGGTFSGDSYVEILFYALGMAYILAIFFSISFSASSVVEESENCRIAFGTLIAKTCATSNTKDNHFLLKVQLFERHFDNAQLQLTGWRFFVVTRGFIVNVLAAFFTYTAVLVQLAQGKSKDETGNTTKFDNN